MTLTLEQVEAFRNGLKEECDPDTQPYFDLLCDMARERLHAGTLQQGLDAAAKVCDVERLRLERERQDWNMDVDQRQINAAKIESAKKCAHAIRNLKPEVGNG